MEDPAVLKELVKLINKAGGIENLEKQLLVHKNGSVVYKDPDTQQISTTTAPISASLYDKISNRNRGLRKEYQPIASRQSFSSSTENVVDAEAKPSGTFTFADQKKYQTINFRQKFATTTENNLNADEEEEESATVAQKLQPKLYQSIRSRQSTTPVTVEDTKTIASGSVDAPSLNSRGGPQSQGLDQLNEFGGLLRERPEYTVLSRTKSPVLEMAEDEGTDQEEGLDVDTTTAQQGVFNFKYVNVQRGVQRAQVDEDKSEEVILDLEPTIRPFTASSPRGFAPR